MRIQVNGEAREVEQNISLSQLVAVLNLKAEQVAIELNHTVVRRSHLQDTLLKDNYNVEIVHFVGGG